MKILISESQLKKLIKESASVDANGNLSIESNIFDGFPEDVLETLKRNYLNKYTNNFDWNQKSDELGNGMNKFLKDNDIAQFLKYKNKIISDIRQDLILLRRKAFAEKKLKEFEDLIKPVFGKHITGRALSKFEEYAISYSDATPESIERAFQDAKNVIDSEGNIDSSKMEKSTMFPGGDINIPNFERFVVANPEYRKMFDIWHKLHEQHLHLLLTDTNAFHIISYKQMKRLYDFLIGFNG